jgi:hypothetical protein
VKRGERRAVVGFTMAVNGWERENLAMGLGEMAKVFI